ncbi:FAD-binding oxidoreductase [Aestuariibacter sp. GS-14]|uniref:NAD(P)/FAD-dependent oxidoreductase n=1 Tax=Aestuariibacter sp. GS-14 TaxID=2590670 RepID=UPI001128AD6F|nr:FAD-binding oxidoreductase [Aestuariibacter sp. GS-14]TPV59979.1 FAD-binding oxidoreductase [Aestuariibacter sp. GS-14]
MSPALKKISNSEKFPDEVDVVVIGGGIIGASATYFLAKQGYSVALIEKGLVGCEQSSRNWGWCRQQNRDERELPTSGLSMRLWDEMSRDIGLDLGFRRCGLIYTTDDPKQLAEWESWRSTAKQFDINTKMLSAKEANLTVPAKGRNWIGGVHSVDDGKGEPSLAAPTIVEGAKILGAYLHQQCAARGLDITNGKVTGVVTEKGTIKTSRVLCAAGAWASTFCRHLGVDFPQASVRQTALRTAPTANLGEAIYTSGCALTRRLDGSYTIALSGTAKLEITPQGLRYAKEFFPMFLKRLKAVQIGLGSSFFSGPEAINRWENSTVSPMELIRILDPAPSKQNARKTIAAVKSMFPALANVDIVDSWGGYVDCTPDAVPVISEVDNVEGFYLAAGCSGHGFGLGPGLAKVASDLVVGAPPVLDLTPFRLSRFHGGEKLEVGAL